MALEERALPDAEARRRAATDFATNLVVLAGAGTGKTSLLVERVLNAIGSGVATLDSIAAITFTEKAAGEMRERVAAGLDRLRALGRNGGPLDDGREADRAFRHLVERAGVERAAIGRRALAAMELLDRGTVVTIHRFCAELLRGWPLEAGVDPGFAVDSGARMATLSREAWESFVKQELGPAGRHAGEWEPLLARIPLSKIGDAVLRLAGFAVPAELLDPPSAVCEASLLDAEARRVWDEVAGWLAREEDLTDLARSCFHGIHGALDALLIGGPVACQGWLADHADLASRLENDRLGSAAKAAGLAAGREVERVTREARELLRAVQRIDERALAALRQVARRFVPAFRERYLRQGLVGFDGLLALARDLLRDAPDVRRALKQRYRLLLVDEFQDTDPLQYEIVLFLAERLDDAATDPFRARLAAGRLFVVGDAKQSVYRFRGADYAAYRRAVGRIVEEGGVTLDLVGNFRSVPGLIEPVNQLFTQAAGAWRSSDWQPAYVPIRAVRPDGAAGPALELWTVELSQGAGAEERREAEGRVLAEAIERWVERERRWEYRQITILFRALTMITHYLRPLRERGIPFVVDGGKDFLRRPEVAQLMATLGALVRPADQPALLAFLRSPAGAASDLELARYAASGNRWSWRVEPDRGEFPNIARAFATLRGLWSDIASLPVDALVRRVLDRTLQLPLAAAAFEGAQRVANLQKLAAAAGELARDGSLSLAEVIEAIEQGRLEDIETDRPLADDAAQAVRITSIHRMKGLENDVVVLPDLGRQRGEFPPNPVAVPVLPGGERVLALSVGGTSNAARVWHDLEERRHEQSEELRVFYVALTRARERFVLLAAPSRPTPWLATIGAWDYAASAPPPHGALLAGGRVRHERRQVPARHRPPEEELPAAASQATSGYERARQVLASAARPPLVAPSGLHDDRPTPAPAGGGGATRGSPRSRDVGQAAGIVLHRLLERWDGSDREGLRRALAAMCDATGRETGIASAAIAAEAREILEAFLGTGLARRFGRIARMGAEVPLLVHDRERQQTFRGSIDLLYRDGAGQVVVADYKTDRETDAGALRRTYGAQLAVYAEAVRRALELPRGPRSELWLLRTGEIVTLDEPPPAPPTRQGPPEQLKLW